MASSLARPRKRKVGIAATDGLVASTTSAVKEPFLIVTVVLKQFNDDIAIGLPALVADHARRSANFVKLRDSRDTGQHLGLFQERPVGFLPVNLRFKASSISGGADPKRGPFCRVVEKGTMHQVKVSLSDEQVEFLGRHRSHGFRDRSELVRAALEGYRREVERRELEESADLYLEIYDQDQVLKSWTEDAARNWPE